MTIPAQPIRTARRRREILAGILAAFQIFGFAASRAGAAEGSAAPTVSPIVSGVLQPGETKTFSLPMTAGEYFQVGLSTDAPLGVELANPFGRIEQTAEISAPQVLCGIAATTGVHSLVVRLEAGNRGSAQFVVEREVERPSLTGDTELCLGEREYWRARALENQGEIAAALESYDRALATYARAGDLTGQVKALFRAGRALFGRRGPGDAELARAKYDQALPLAERLAERAATDRMAARACASLWGNAGLQLRGQGNAQGAEKLYARAVAVARAWPDDLDLAERLRTLGDVAMQAGNRETGRASYLEAISLFGLEPTRPTLAARAEIGIGQLADRLASALAHFDVATALAPGSPEIASLARHERCVAFSRFGALGEALVECQEALVLACDTETAKADEAASLNTLGSLYVDLGSYEKASEQFDQARQIFSSVGAQGDAGDALLNRGVAQLALGQTGPAAKSFEQALDLAREAHDVGTEGFALAQLGTLELKRPGGDSARARQWLVEALALAERSNSTALEADARLELASAEALLGRSPEALAQLGTALSLAESLRDPVRQAAVLTRRAEILFGENDLETALATIDQAALLVDGLRAQATSGLRASFLARRRRTFELQIEILIRLHEAKPGAGYDVRAFEASEAARARSLLDLLAERRGEGNAGIPPASALSAAQIQSRMAPGDLLLEYLRAERATFLFAVTRDDLAAFRLDSGAIDGSLRSFTGALANPQSMPQGIRLRAASLYRALLGPVEGSIAKAGRVIVAADGDLYDLPFETLVPPSAGGKASYLVESKTISYVPSASTLARLGDLPVGNGPEFLGFAAPEAGGDLPFLPQVENEVRRIAELFPEQSRTFLGSAATEDRFRAERSLIGTAKRLHFAAHGYLAEDPEQMGIHLSRDPARGGDGLLQAFEILGLDLHADLVVLSACETARGQRVPGEGTLGLPRAFFYAGARSVVVSLWRAEDNATAALMVAFYRALSQGVDKAEALRQAKLERIAAGDVPRLWAPFVLVGSPVR